MDFRNREGRFPGEKGERIPRIVHREIVTGKPERDPRRTLRLEFPLEATGRPELFHMRIFPLEKPNPLKRDVGSRTPLHPAGNGETRTRGPGPDRDTRKTAILHARLVEGIRETGSRRHEEPVVRRTAPLHRLSRLRHVERNRVEACPRTQRPERRTRIRKRHSQGAADDAGAPGAARGVVDKDKPCPRRIGVRRPPPVHRNVD